MTRERPSANRPGSPDIGEKSIRREDGKGIVSGESCWLVGIRNMLNRTGDEDARAMVKACESLWEADGWDKWSHAVVLVE